MSIANPNQYQVSNMLNNIPDSPGGLQYLQQLSKGSNPEVSPIMALAALQAKNKQMAQAANAQGAAAGQQPTIAEQLKMQNAMLQQAHARAQQPVQPVAFPTENMPNQEPIQAAHGGLMMFAQGGQAQDPAQQAQQQAALIAALQQQQTQDAGSGVYQLPGSDIAPAQQGQPSSTQNYMSTAAGTQPMFRRATAPAADVQNLAQQRQYGQGSNPEINPYTASSGVTSAAHGGLMSARLPKDTFKFSRGGILHFDEGGAADNLPDSMIPKVQQPPSPPSPPMTLGTPITNREQPDIYANLFSSRDPGVASATQGISDQQQAYLQSLAKPGQTVVKAPPAPDQRPTMPSDPRVAAVQAAQQGNMQPINQIAAGSAPTPAAPAAPTEQGIASLTPAPGKEPSPKDEQMAILNAELTKAQARLNADPTDARAAGDLAALQKEIKRAGGNPTNLPAFTSGDSGKSATVTGAVANAATNAPVGPQGGLPSALQALQKSPGYLYATNFLNMKPETPGFATDPKVLAQQQKDFLKSQGVELPYQSRDADLNKIQAQMAADDAEHQRNSEARKLENFYTFLRNIRGGTIGQGLANAGNSVQAITEAQRAEDAAYNNSRLEKIQKLADARYSNNMAQVNQVLGFMTQADQHAADAAKAINDFNVKKGEAAGHMTTAESQAAAEDTRAAGNIIDFQIRAEANRIAREQSVSAQNAAVQERAQATVFQRITQEIEDLEKRKEGALPKDRLYYQNLIDGKRNMLNQATQGLARTAGLGTLNVASPPPAQDFSAWGQPKVKQ